MSVAAVLLHSIRGAAHHANDPATSGCNKKPSLRLQVIRAAANVRTALLGVAESLLGGEWSTG